MSSHINVVTLFDASATIVGVSPTSQWMVSEGQPSSWPPTITPSLSPTGNNFSVQFNAGREDTTLVAVTFNDLCGGADHEWGIGAGGTPSKLNFYFGVNIQLQSNGNTATVTAYLGQGSSWPSNNWWIGGACISDGYLTATVGTEPVKFFIGSVNSNGFIFNLVDDSKPSE